MSGNDPCDIYGHVLPLSHAGIDLNHLFSVSCGVRAVQVPDPDLPGSLVPCDGKGVVVADGVGFTLAVDPKFKRKVLRYAKKSLYPVTPRLWIGLDRLIWAEVRGGCIVVSAGDGYVADTGTYADLKRLVKAAGLTRIASHTFAKIETALFVYADKIDQDYSIELGRDLNYSLTVAIGKSCAAKLLTSFGEKGWGWYKGELLVNPSLYTLKNGKTMILKDGRELSMRGFDAVALTAIRSIAWVESEEGWKSNPAIPPGYIDHRISELRKEGKIAPRPALDLPGVLNIPRVPGLTRQAI